ncbi:hypothetical protein KL921_003722 [Ogataea angusta]|uniref:Uncharacterized protein n=1 Tax=Pichia angusta TaxID=870730 RepID=A0AAN6I455_PICAN|nr:uncharacterized protein KL928_003962 [Ogataea angusta]KAG7808640.1 hypothetical protein KL921_003722 [Ogataea angusta]KAG7817227.1 hypothetical protein KL928_003962 [Ogataea angusta]KAG7823545.1 hypothetical protein KL909_002942 [Ogataea angusta]KAG7828733.1 hypothetical protein KL920_003229 [Ogataea angusta]KAG7839289.1 hypothetical protein KL942_003651 [Ogataea angusta]
MPANRNHFKLPPTQAPGKHACSWCEECTYFSAQTRNKTDSKSARLRDGQHKQVQKLPGLHYRGPGVRAGRREMARRVFPVLEVRQGARSQLELPDAGNGLAGVFGMLVLV